jgi:hypothetical protein
MPPICPTGSSLAIDEEVTRMRFIHAHARPYLTALTTGFGMILTKENIQFQNSLQVAR